MVRDFLGIHGSVLSPKGQHPKRTIEGFDCKRSEVSGTRLWGFVKDRFNTPEAFFKRFFVANYCPLVFLEESGKNRTPDKLRKSEKAPLFAACDAALRDTIEALGATHVIGIGAFALARIRQIFEKDTVRIGTILHPSPASPMANRGWAIQAEKQLSNLGVL
jgi:single-strand selective monofunctional uracil DNA glycosylase